MSSQESGQQGERAATFKDLFKGAVIAGLVAGIFSSIPVLSWVNWCCFCLPILLAGAGSLAVTMKNPLTLTSGTALGAGGLAGVVAGIVASIGNFFFSVFIALFMAGAMRDFYREVLPRELRNSDMFEAMTAGGVSGAFIGLIANLFMLTLLYAVMGAIGSFAMAQFKFKDRLK